MLRIANWYESRLGRNDGNPLYVTTCLGRMQYYLSIEAGLGHNQGLLKYFSIKNPNAKLLWDQYTADPHAEASAKKFYAEHKEILEIDHFCPTGDVSPYGTYDLNLHVDWGEDGLVGILPYKPIPTPKPMAYWASDTHIKAGDIDSYNYRLETARRADYLFVAQKAGVERMKADGLSPIWLPHAFEPQAYPKLEKATKKYDVCFVGHINTGGREKALDRLFREFPNFYYGQALFNDAADKFSDSKVCFNYSWSDDINMRVFETLGTGSFLLTNWIPTIEDLFEDGKHLVLYRSEEEMIDKAKFYVDHDEAREKIAQAGYDEVISKHTVQHRVDAILIEAMSKRLVSA